MAPTRWFSSLHKVLLQISPRHCKSANQGFCEQTDWLKPNEQQDLSLLFSPFAWLCVWQTLYKFLYVYAWHKWFQQRWSPAHEPTDFLFLWGVKDPCEPATHHGDDYRKSLEPSSPLAWHKDVHRCSHVRISCTRAPGSQEIFNSMSTLGWGLDLSSRSLSTWQKEERKTTIYYSR